MTRFLPMLAAFALLVPSPGRADDVSDALTAALEAYRAGDVQYAIEELDFARQALLAMKTDALGAYLPDAPAGWTREINTEMNAGMAMMGGGVGAEATYTGPSGDSYTLTMMADNPMIASIAAMMANAGMMGVKTERINRQRFMLQDGEFTGVINNRVMLSAKGGTEEVLRTALESMDFKALGDFGN